MTIDDRIEKFKCELVKGSPATVVREHILQGGCFALEDGMYSELRSEVGKNFDIHPNQVLVVGSSKLGFSVAPTKRYRAFGDSSDIDVVIVSSVLFEKIWRAAYEYRESGAYWEKWKIFSQYLFRGWVRPDHLPSVKSFEVGTEWWEFFNSLSSKQKYSKYKIRGALYHDWWFLESYHMKTIAECYRELVAGSGINENKRD